MIIKNFLGNYSCAFKFDSSSFSITFRNSNIRYTFFDCGRCSVGWVRVNCVYYIPHSANWKMLWVSKTSEHLHKPRFDKFIETNDLFITFRDKITDMIQGQRNRSLL